MKQKILWILAAILAILCDCFTVHAQETYLAPSELPDLVKSLPAPPQKGSPAFKYDVERYKWGKEQRKDPARMEMVRSYAVWTYEALIGQLSPAFGLHLSKEETPQIWSLLESSLLTIDPIRVAPKAYFHRIRPFEYFKEHTSTGEDAELSGEGSYPSVHTIRSWLTALLLAEVNPARADEIYARAWTYGESRVIAGAHWQSDVDASRAAASIGYGVLQTSPLFRAQMEKAKEEFRSAVLVPITDMVPDVILEIRYYGTYNFVGARIDGYEEPTALLTKKAAEALKAVSDDVKAQGYRLKIYDAYRPKRAWTTSYAGPQPRPMPE